MPLIHAIAHSAEFRIDKLAGGTDARGRSGLGVAASGRRSPTPSRASSSSSRPRDVQSQALALGQSTDIAGVTMAVERANLAMQLAVQVRNKAVDAYHEIFRMQI